MHCKSTPGIVFLYSLSAFFSFLIFPYFRDNGDAKARLYMDVLVLLSALSQVSVHIC